MVNNTDLKEIESKIFSSYFNDGMWDIYGGLIMLGFGLGIVTGQTIVMIACVLVAMIPVFIRKPIIMARLGSVEFSSERQEKTRKYKTAAVIIGSAGLLLGVVFACWYSLDSMPGWLDVWMRDYFFVFVGSMLAILISIAAYLTGVKRFYAYALTIFVVFLLAALLRSRDMEGIPITAGGGLVLASGIFILIRFLIRNPLPAKGEDR